MAKTIKTTLTIQHEGVNVTEKQIIEKIKKVWVESGNLIKDINSLDIYVKPSEKMVYYVINETECKMPISEVISE